MISTLPFNEKEIEVFSNNLKEKGYLYIKDLDNDFDHFSFAQEFGKLLPQYDGQIVWSIKADPKFDDEYHSLNTKKLSPHTECYEFEGLPPKYLALWCVTPTTCDGGYTTLYDTKNYFESLDNKSLNLVKSTPVEFVSSSGIQKSSLGRNAKHPLLRDKEDNYKSIVRFSQNCMKDDSLKEIKKIANNLVEEFESNHDSIRWEKNAFLIWDNHRVIHSRTSYKDRNRELRRVWLS